MTIGIGSDHKGFLLKNQLYAFLQTRGERVQDIGAFSEEAVDYPDIAAVMVAALRSGAIQRGILVCRTGLGMAIAANKAPGIFAAPASDIPTARSARQSNDVQILTLGSYNLTSSKACAIVEAWLAEEFRGGDSARKIEKIRLLEDCYLTEALAQRVQEK